MTRTLFLHLGPAKTGTSAIQYVLGRHDGSIVLYPKVGLWSDGSHHNLVLNFFGDDTRPETIREDAGRLLARIGEESRRSDRDLVVSSEILAGRKNLGEFITALQSAIGGELRVVLVAVVREHLERAASLYNQRVKDAVFSERRDPDEFLLEHPERLCYANLLRRLKRTGFELAVLNYHPAEDLVARCLAQFGFSPGQIPQPPRRNVSLSRKALIATLVANRLSDAPEDRSRFDAGLRSISGRFASSEIFFGSEAIARVRRIISADRKFLRKEFGLQLPRRRLQLVNSPFVLNGDEFADIAAAMRDLGDNVNDILEALRLYVRVPLPAT
ncbi:MAG: hypothetical protein ACREHV_04430 [Rhizomicrobium sp.]